MERSCLPALFWFSRAPRNLLGGGQFGEEGLQIAGGGFQETIVIAVIYSSRKLGDERGALPSAAEQADPGRSGSLLFPDVNCPATMRWG